MATRDLSPTAWTAPGAARLSIHLIQSALSDETVPFDVWVNDYSPLYVGPPILTDGSIGLANGFNAIKNPDTTNDRFFILVPPRGNTTGLTLKGVTGDTGLALNPNGPIVLSLPASSQPASVGITTTGAITGVKVYWL